MKLKAIAALSALAFIAAAPVFAEKPAGGEKGMTFEQKKDASIKWIDRRIGVLQDLKNCVSGARDKEDLQKCREKFKEEREGMKKDWKEKRSGKEKKDAGDDGAEE